MYKQKNFSWNARPFGPILCFQIQIGDRDCIPTPGMQIQIGRFSYFKVPKFDLIDIKNVKLCWYIDTQVQKCASIQVWKVKV